MSLVWMVLFLFDFLLFDIANAQPPEGEINWPIPMQNREELMISGGCDYDHKCPESFVCQHLTALPGIKACVYKTSDFHNSTSKRPGTMCPIIKQSAEPMDINGPRPRPPPVRRNPCNGHEDCPLNKRCCPMSFADLAYCTDPQRISPETTVTPIIIGYQNITESVYEFISSVTLVQSKEYNVLVDTSAPRTNVLENLWAKAGLLSQDIDLVVESHGHADHFSNIRSFEDAYHVYNTRTYTWHFYKPNPLDTDQKYFLNNDPNLEVIQTPGHTPQDVTLIVRNTVSGTVAIVGDLIATAEDSYDRFAWNRTLSDINRRKVACSADYVVPGHGPMFRIDDAQRRRFQCDK